jgi:hypothetical protein
MAAGNGSTPIGDRAASGYAERAQRVFDLSGCGRAKAPVETRLTEARPCGVPHVALAKTPEAKPATRTATVRHETSFSEGDIFACMALPYAMAAA